MRKWDTNKAIEYAKTRNYEIIGEYKPTHEGKMLLKHISEKCNNHVFEMTWNRFYNTESGCPECNGTKKLTLEFCIEYAMQFNYKILSSEYIDTNKKLVFQHCCKDCDNYVFEMTFSHFHNQGNRCPKCAGVAPLDIDYCKKYAQERGFEILDSEINGAKTKLKFKHVCKDCDFHITEMTWNQFHSGQKCKKCSRKLSPSKNIINNLCEEKGYICLNPEIYKNQFTELTFQHKCCGTIFVNCWKHLNRSEICPVCRLTSISESRRKNVAFSGKDLTITDPEICKEWSSKNKLSPNLYTRGSGKKVYWKCKNGHEDYLCTVHNHVIGRGCPACNESRGEKEIAKYLDEYSIDFKREYSFKDCKKDNRPLEFDFYILEKNILIEYQGEQHYKPVDFAGRGIEWSNKEYLKNQIRDKIKKDYSNNNNIKLLEIPYWDFERISEILTQELSLN
jgi:hypothetical protein